MIRFIDLRNQGTYYRFAFWDTVCDEFVNLDGTQAWDSKADLLESIEWHYDKHYPGAKAVKEKAIQRYTGLIPDWAIVDDGKGEEQWEAD